MRYVFIVLTIGLAIFGFFAPMAWIGAVITAILAVLFRQRNIEKECVPKFRDLLRVNTLEDCGMRTCPFCLKEIKADSRKCIHCGEWVEPSKGFKICVHCGAKNKMEAFQCNKCKRVI